LKALRNEEYQSNLWFGSLLIKLGEGGIAIAELRSGNSAGMDERSVRLAQNETVFRAANEAIEGNRGDRGSEELTFLCECGVQTCFERIELTREEYEGVRAEPARFFVAPGHEDLTAGEFVVEETSRYTVVEKRGEERTIVERSDPRRSRQ